MEENLFGELKRVDIDWPKCLSVSLVGGYPLQVNVEGGVLIRSKHREYVRQTCWPCRHPTCMFRRESSTSGFEATTSTLRKGKGVKILVKRGVRNPVDPSQLVGCGSTFFANGYEDDNNSGLVLMQTIAGVTEGGREVIAAVAPAKLQPGASVEVESHNLVDKPNGLDWDRAAMLPFLAVNCLCPLSMVGFKETTVEGKSCVVTGGHGSLAPFVAQVLKAWGAKVWSVTTNTVGMQQKVGTGSVMDFRKDSYSDKVEKIDLVVDTIGREMEESQRQLKETKGAAYVSLMPDVLKVAVDEGILFGAGKIMQYGKALARDNARVYFLPSTDAVNLVASMSHSAAVAPESGGIDMGAVGGDYVGMPEYIEALAWPKDMETGLRFGFPGKTGRKWGWLGNGEAGEEEVEEEVEEEEEEEEEGEIGGEEMIGVGEEVKKDKEAVDEGPPMGVVIPVMSGSDMRLVTGERDSLLFVSSRSCRVCKYLSNYYKKLAAKQTDVVFMHVDASQHPQIARSLGLEAVPTFVSYRRGKVLNSVSTSDKQRIEALLEELCS
ncbi:unnamed protein product [Discosporangium mesarthrocarpum]